MSVSFEMPTMGFGTWKIPRNITATVVYEAIKFAQIRHLDCACDYGNEVEVGEGIRRAITEGVVRREDLWITSKLWNTYHSPIHVAQACRKSISDLGIDYLDLYLIHFPFATKFVPFETRYPPEWIFDPNAESPGIEMDWSCPMHLTWAAMEDLVTTTRLARHIGVCNFNVQLLIDILSYCTIRPYCNQVEMHPYLSQNALLDFCSRVGIRCVAFSPLGSSSYIELNMDQSLGKGVLSEPIIATIAASHQMTPAQVVLKWNLQRGVHAVIPKSSQLSRIIENSGSCSETFHLSEDEMAAISQLNKNIRFNDPGEFCKSMGGAIPIYN